MEKSKTTNGKNTLIDVVTTREEKGKRREEKRREEKRREEKRREHKVYYDVSGWKELKQRSH